jgi:hypothetical protein
MGLFVEYIMIAGLNSDRLSKALRFGQTRDGICSDHSLVRWKLVQVILVIQSSFVHPGIGRTLPASIILWMLLLPPMTLRVRVHIGATDPEHNNYLNERCE